MQFLLSLFLTLIMRVVRVIRRDSSDYLSAPDEILSWIKVDRIKKFAHILPSFIIAILVAIKLLPSISTAFAEQLDNNGSIVPITVIVVLIVVLIINGILLETILEKTDHTYRNYKQQSPKINFF